MSDKSIKLSVVIPVYNRTTYYKEAITSIEAQNYLDFNEVEVVLVSNIKLNDEFTQILCSFAVNYYS